MRTNDHVLTVGALPQVIIGSHPFQFEKLYLDRDWQLARPIWPPVQFLPCVIVHFSASGAGHSVFAKVRPLTRAGSSSPPLSVITVIRSCVREVSSLPGNPRWSDIYGSLHYIRKDQIFLS